MTLDLLNPVFGVVAMGLALATAHLLGRWLPVETRGRNVPLDGLRGYMAFGVFLYHSLIWYDYLHSGTWAPPAASVYRPVGDLCVKVFFMITAYLFVGKIIDSRRRPIDWLALFVSRVLRLTPLYLVAVVVLVATTFALTHWTVQVPMSELANRIGQWLAFTMIGAPDINGLHDTWLLIAGVTWTLGYEWLFYLSLPLIALLIRRPVPMVVVLICTAMVAWLVAIKPGIFGPWSFFIGAVAAAIARMPSIADRLRGPGVALAVLAAAAVAVYAEGFHEARLAALAALVVVFVPIACGNPVFGVLTHRASLLLGEVSYGLYLLHGLLLSIVIELVIGPEVARTLSPVQHWMLVSVVGIVLVFVACLAFRWVERPAMQSSQRWTQWIRQLGSTLSRRQKA